jgi:hypothetical protein
VTEVGSGGCEVTGRRRYAHYTRSLQGVGLLRAMEREERDRSIAIVHVIYMMKNILVLVVVS